MIALVILIRKEGKALSIAFLLPPLAFLFLQLSPFWFNTQSLSLLDQVEKESKSIFYSNVFSGNQNKDLLIEYLKKENPNIAMLVEINSDWVNEIKHLETNYPYMKAIIRDGNFGMAVLSKNELIVKQVLFDRENGIPALYLNVMNGQKPFRLLLLHSFPPIGKYGTLVRDRYLKTIAGIIADDQGPLLICGDFNTAPWTSVFGDFLERSRLDKAIKTPLLRTWPVGPFPILPIDHCLSKNMTITHYQKGPDIGSDHWPIELQLQFGEPSPSNR